MTIVAPKRMDLTMSPCVQFPHLQSMVLRAALEHQRSATSCHPPVPKPVLILLLHTLPGPIPTLVASAPAFSNSERLLAFLRYLRSQRPLVNVFLI